MIFSFFKKSPVDEYKQLVKQREDEEIARINQKLRAVASERPALAPPAQGKISVGYKHIDDAVYVWIELSEIDKQVLTDARLLDTTIDEIDDHKAIQEKLDSYSEIMDATTDDINAMLPRGIEMPDEDKPARLKEYRAELLENNKVPVRHLISNPYRRSVANSAEAAAFIEKLKSKILPHLKSLIETHSKPLSGIIDL